jgi:uncharacterized protein
MNRLETYKPEIKNLCETHFVKSLYAFGSVLNDNFNAESDVDLIVDFTFVDLKDYADNYFDLKFRLQDMLQRPIDLLEEKAIKNPDFRNSVNLEKILIYG